ncbi:SET domain-containing protein [Colletotrichum graminicola]|uniref:SET domain-containing protein n=1 Tax=Colletotrichum graminicola (strain M1.001 / M2 / FGSC 10212) TaxID=645133 RepID=E3QW29_COLGM|nr:SET domain-containing protein [Colletotrichum graminicola M1.001]EFQ35067.1 SET domain-containing protein [Colletotrichum graminicola M1.001]WDK20433.1 SET domain-containing protein [Colletotrichum graminicola]
MAASQLPLDTLSTWAMFNDVDLVDVEAREIPGCGLGLVSNKDLSREEETLDIPTLLRIPHELILSAEAVENYAKVDKNFRQLLNVAGHKSTRHDICIFLLTQQILADQPETSLHGGVPTPWTEYIKYLPPQVPVTTLWTVRERQMLNGTSLESATAAKIVALSDEFDELREVSSSLPLWNELFWESGKVSLIDWVRVDAWFRSRCLELPKSGEAMVPVLDLANHSSKANAYYEQNSKDEVVLLLRPGCRVSSGEEMTISYGDAKSGAEMLFSYGFIDPASAADRITLPLTPLEDDPLGKAKLHIFEGPPTVEFVRTNHSVSWESPFAYLMCLNEEDGLSFRILQDTGGSRELKLFWQEEDVTTTTAGFGQHIGDHPLAQIFRLRVVTVLQDLVTNQLERLATGMPLEDLDESLNEGGLVCGACINAAAMLREQETRLLEAAVKALEDQKTQLLADESVVAYLGSMEDTQNDLAEGEVSNDEEDFS